MDAFYRFRKRLVYQSPLGSRPDAESLDDTTKMQTKPRLTRRDWHHAIRSSLAFTAIAVVASFLGSNFLLSTLSAGLDLAGTVAAVAVPLVVAGPTTFYLSIKNAQLRDAYRRLEVAASHDCLTGCLNHGAFVAQAQAFLEGEGQFARGALLVVDADYFKSVNDRFGHHIGDIALRQVAERIRNAVGRDNLVGRLGGEEFGVLLKGLDRNQAAAVAERIRGSVQRYEFGIEGKRFPLSVSIGGAVFERQVDYNDLFRSADERLYKVKNSGRNNVDLMHFALDQSPAPQLLKTG